ncbi:MAG: NAD-dependent epimerase/dehydratase family protein [Candidatus Hermodarchaeota archaeon]
MANILITGGTGFIGVPLVKKLQSLGHKLKLLVRESSNITPFENLANIEFIMGDIRDNETCKRASENIDIIYHLAAYTRMWAKNNQIIEDTNIKGTENIAKIALEKKIRLMYISSFIALGATPVDPVDETFESEDGLYLDYAKTKFQAKRIIKEYLKKGLNGIIFYPGIVYGPGDFNIFGQTIHDITARKFLGCPGKGDNIGNFVYLNDVIDGVVSIIDRNDLNGEEFILGGENVEFNYWLNLIADIAGNTKNPRHFPISLANIYAYMCELKTKLTKKMPYINRPTVKMINHNWSYSSDKAIEKLGYKITPLREGLEHTILWYKDYIEQGKKKGVKA